MKEKKHLRGCDFIEKAAELIADQAAQSASIVISACKSNIEDECELCCIRKFIENFEWFSFTDENEADFHFLVEEERKMLGFEIKLDIGNFEQMRVAQDETLSFSFYCYHESVFTDSHFECIKLLSLINDADAAIESWKQDLKKYIIEQTSEWRSEKEIDLKTSEE